MIFRVLKILAFIATAILIVYMGMTTLVPPDDTELESLGHTDVHTGIA